VYRYDLSAIPANTPIISAVARFYVSKEHPEGPIDIHLLNKDWTEATANWDLLGNAMDAKVQATIPAQPISAVWVSVNLTPVVQAWVNGQANFGITLNSRGDGAHGDYASREATTTAPYLQVVTGTLPLPVAQLKAVGTLENGISRTLLRSEVSLQQAPASYLHWQHDASLGVDAYIWEFNEFSNYGNDDEVWVANSNNNASRSLFKFAVERLPRGAKVIDATLSLEHESGSDPNVSITAHRITSGWEEDEVTWRQRRSGISWNTDGGDFDAAVFATTSVGPTSGIRYEWNLTDLVQGWVDGTYPNHGVILATAENGIFGERFFSSDETIETRRPRLTITYTCACGKVCSQLQGSAKIAFIGDDWQPDDDDEPKIELLESWGYEVDFYHDRDSHVIDWGLYDLAYVSETAIASDVNADLKGYPIGVVNEEPELYDDLLLASGDTEHVGSSIDIVDNSHFITSVFPPGALSIYQRDMEILSASKPHAAGLQVLGEFKGNASLTVIDAGAETTSGPATGRRVTLPLGQHFAAGFDWTHLNNNGLLLVQRAIEWASGGGGPAMANILLVVDNAWSLTDQENAKKVLFESWGYAVNVIDSGDNQGTFDAAVAANDIVYIGEDINSGDLGTKLVDASIGIVTEEANLADEFGFHNDGIDWGSGTSLTITPIRHYITDTLPTGTLTILSANESLVEMQNGLAPDIQTLGTSGGSLTLATLDTGAALAGGGSATGPRVLLPWGGSGMDINNLNEDGRTILQRSLEWANGARLDLAPLAHWKLDEDNGTTAIDSEGGHDGTLVNDPVWVNAQMGGGLAFDGNDGHVRVGHSSDFELTDGTITMWIKAVDVAGEQYLFFKDGADKTYLLIKSGEIAYETNGDTITAPVTANDWTHVAITFGTDGMSLYLQGSLVASSTKTDGMADNNGDLFIGSDSLAGKAFAGTLDEVRIYDRILSAGEIAELATPPPKLPIAHWKLDETSGLTAVDSVGGHDGTLESGPTWTTGEVDGALDFDGSNDHVAVPHSSKLDLSGEFTISTWFQADSLGDNWDPYRTFLGKYPNSSTANYWFGTWGDELAFGFYAGGSFHAVYSTGLGLQPGRWYHATVIFTDAGNAAKLYIDGVGIAKGEITASPPPNTGDVVIGQTAVGERWDGQLDDIRIYDELLTDAEIAALTAAGGGGGGGSGPVTGSVCDGTYRDNFDNRVWNGSNGSLGWNASPWAEVGESDGATGGDVQITNDVSDYQLRIQDKQNGGEGVAREVNLDGASSATLTFNYRRDGLDNSNDYVAVYASSTGTAGPWTELPAPRIQGGGSDGSYQTYTRDISAFISANTAIRLRSSPDLGGRDIVWFDNLEISCSP
jgi:hypothetical protein